MQNNVNTNVERIIAKIDNDFNPDHSDWIPRVGAWCIEAMGLINALPTIKVKKELKVHNRIAYSLCNLNDNITIYDSNGCKIEKAKETRCECNVSSTGNIGCGATNATEITPSTINIVNNPSASHNSTYVKADLINEKEYPGRYNVVGYSRYGNNNNHNYVIVNDNKIELNFDTDCIIIEYDGIKTYESDIFNCELPVIPNNAILIEAIVNYCMYKMLCRGYKHPVLNLAASQYGTNPYYIWKELKDEANRSIIIDGIDEDITKIMRSNFFINTFDSRR